MSVNLKALLLQKRVEGKSRKAYSAAKKTGKSKIDASSYAKKQKHEQVRADCVGLILEWKDKNPLGSDGCANELPKATSVNHCPIVRDGVVTAFNDDTYRTWLITQNFLWEIDVELIYKLSNHKSKTHKIDPVFFKMRGCMKDPEGDLSTINQRIEKAVTYSMLVNIFRPDGNKNKGVFEVANYRVSIIGL